MNGKALRSAIRDGDSQDVLNILAKCYKELLKNEIIDDFDFDDAIEAIDDVDVDSRFSNTMVDSLLTDFYDLCDDLGIWVSI